MMRFMTFLEIQLSPGMKDIRDCRWAKPTHRAATTYPHPQRTSLDISPEPLDPSEPYEPPVPPKSF